MPTELEEVRRRIDEAKSQIVEYERRYEAARASPTGGHRLIDLTAAIRKRRDLISELELREHQLLDADELQQTANRIAEAKQLAEDRAFWVRRFHTSLAIAHGAAFVALASHLFDGDRARLAFIAGATFVSMLVFGTGMLLAGAIPFVMYRGWPKAAERLAFGSAGLFAVGVIAALGGVYRAAGF